MATSICGVIITTNRMAEMVAFYERALGVTLEREEHGDLDVHYGVDFENRIHFALHPPGDFSVKEPGQASVKVAFAVERLAPAVERLAEAGIAPFIAPHDEGFGPVAAFKDPDDNILELVELTYDFG